MKHADSSSDSLNPKECSSWKGNMETAVAERFGMWTGFYCGRQEKMAGFCEHFGGSSCCLDGK
jgi:hypothetical protein